MFILFNLIFYLKAIILNNKKRILHKKLYIYIFLFVNLIIVLCIFILQILISLDFRVFFLQEFLITQSIPFVVKKWSFGR